MGSVANVGVADVEAVGAFEVPPELMADTRYWTALPTVSVWSGYQTRQVGGVGDERGPAGGVDVAFGLVTGDRGTARGGRNPFVSADSLLTRTVGCAGADGGAPADGVAETRFDAAAGPTLLTARTSSCRRPRLSAR